MYNVTVIITIYDMKGYKKGWFEILTFVFSSNFNAIIFENDHLYGLLLDHKKIVTFYLLQDNEVSIVLVWQRLPLFVHHLEELFWRN